jgi:flavin reductase (DIM6/NTAB) family NADH-FMN oxidoreductase RutF
MFVLLAGVSATVGVSSAAVTGSSGGSGTAMSDEGFGAIMSALDTPLVVVTAAQAQEKAGCLVGFHCQSSIEPSRYCVWLSKANHTYRVALGFHSSGYSFPHLR